MLGLRCKVKSPTAEHAAFRQPSTSAERCQNQPSNVNCAQLLVNCDLALTNRRRPSKIGPMLMALAGAVVLTLLAWLQCGGLLVLGVDDAYIHLALAESLLTGTPRLSDGDPAFASSSLLWPWLLTPTAHTAWQPATAWGIGLMALAVSAAVVGRWLRHPKYVGVRAQARITRSIRDQNGACSRLAKPRVSHPPSRQWAVGQNRHDFARALNLRPLQTSIATLGVVVGGAQLGLPLLGMEHGLQGALAIVILAARSGALQPFWAVVAGILPLGACRKSIGYEMSIRLYTMNLLRSDRLLASQIFSTVRELPGVNPRSFGQLPPSSQTALGASRNTPTRS